MLRLRKPHCDFCSQLAQGNQQMDFSYSPKVEALRERLTTFMDAHVYPNEAGYFAALDEGETRWTVPPIIEELKARARDARSEEHTSELQSRENLVCR